METIGDRIKKLRVELNLTQTQFAEKLCTTQDTVSLWEREKELPTVDFVIKICKTFNISSDYLLGLESI